jgi:hypothetical protein
MVFNTTFNNISIISWQAVLLVEETRVSRENHDLYHIMLYEYTSPERGSTRIQWSGSISNTTEFWNNAKAYGYAITAGVWNPAKTNGYATTNPILRCLHTTKIFQNRFSNDGKKFFSCN